MSSALRVLILGGSSDATSLARALAGKPDVTAVISLAGRTREPAPQPLPTRIGGFGGVEGLIAYLRTEAIDLLVDATHPFAVQITQNARAASEATRTPLIRVERPGWSAVAGDRWREVDDIEEAVEALGVSPRRVFLTVGRLRLAAFARAPWHQYIVRTIDPATETRDLPETRQSGDESNSLLSSPRHGEEVLGTVSTHEGSRWLDLGTPSWFETPPSEGPHHEANKGVADPVALLRDATFIQARPPFDARAEAALMRAHRIDVLVTKNSGGMAAYGKLVAARDLGVPVILVKRPAASGAPLDVERALAAIAAHARSARRGV